MYYSSNPITRNTSPKGERERQRGDEPHPSSLRLQPKKQEVSTPFKFDKIVDKNS